MNKHHIFQRNDTECCWCVASMVHSLKGNPKSVDEIKRAEGCLEPPFYSYGGQIARYLHSQNFATKLLVSNAKLIPSSCSKLPRDELSECLRQWSKEHSYSPLAIEAEWISKFLDAGGELQCVPLTVGLVRSKLSQGSLLIPFLDEVGLWGQRSVKGELGVMDNVRGETLGHAVLLRQLHGDEVEIWDPYPTGIQGRNGCYAAPLEDVMLATLTWDAMIVEVM